MLQSGPDNATNVTRHHRGSLTSPTIEDDFGNPPFQIQRLSSKYMTVDECIEKGNVL